MFRCCVELDVVPPCQSSRFSTCQALAGVDLLSLDGLRAVRCLDSVAFPEVRRFLRVAKWVYKAGQMPLRLQVHGVSFEGLGGTFVVFGSVTTILCFLPELW